MLSKPVTKKGSSLFIALSCVLASARSKGALFVSATEPIKNIRNTGNNGTINHIALWVSMPTVRLRLPVSSITSNIAELKINS